MAQESDITYGLPDDDGDDWQACALEGRHPLCEPHPLDDLTIREEAELREEGWFGMSDYDEEGICMDNCPTGPCDPNGGDYDTYDTDTDEVPHDTDTGLDDSHRPHEYLGCVLDNCSTVPQAVDIYSDSDGRGDECDNRDGVTAVDPKIAEAYLRRFFGVEGREATGSAATIVTHAINSQREEALRAIAQFTETHGRSPDMSSQGDYAALRKQLHYPRLRPSA